MRNAVLIVLAAAAFGVAVYFWHKPVDHAGSPAPGTQPPVTAAQPGPDSGEAGPAAGPTAGLPTTSPGDSSPETEGSESAPDPRAEFREAPDLLTLAEKYHARATQGDAAAQYWLYRTLARCGAEYRANFGESTPKGEQILSLEQAMQRNPTMTAAQSDSLRKQHGQCEKLRASNPMRFGLAGDWLQAASNSGYPLAQVETASRRVSSAVQHGGCGGRQKSCEEARASALAAVRSSDPEVLVKAGNMVHLLNAEGGNPSARTLEGYAWTLAGCLRGADCTQEQDWVQSWCRSMPDCYPGEGGADFIRRSTGASFAEVERRAQEIIRLIDAKQWDELQFD